MTRPEDAIIKKLQRLRKTFPEVAIRYATELAGEARQEIKKETVRNTPGNVTIGRTPVKTGDLVSTTRVVAEGDSVSVVVGGDVGKSGTFVDYAFYVERGTSRFKGRFMVQGGVMRALRNKNSLAKKGINSWLRQINK